MMHSSTIAGSMPARRTASATTSAPSCGAEKFLSEPRNFPVAVRTALTITASRTNDNLRNHIVAEQPLHPAQDDLRRPADLIAPRRGLRVYEQHALLEADCRRALQRRTDRRLPGEFDLAGRKRRVAQQLGECTRDR